MAQIKSGNLIGTIAMIGALLAIIGSGWLILDVGIEQSMEVLTNDTANITADTTAAFGGSVDFLDRASVFASYVTLLVATGILAVAPAGRDNQLQQTINTVVVYYPLFGLAIAFLGFWDIVVDMAFGDYDFGAHSDGVNAHMMAVTGWAVSALGTLFNNGGKLK